MCFAFGGSSANSPSSSAPRAMWPITMVSLPLIRDPAPSMMPRPWAPVGVPFWSSEAPVWRRAVVTTRSPRMRLRAVVWAARAAISMHPSEVELPRMELCCPDHGDGDIHRQDACCHTRIAWSDGWAFPPGAATLVIERGNLSPGRVELS